MKNKTIFLAVLVVFALLCMMGITAASDTPATETAAPEIQDTLSDMGTDEVTPYDGPIGAESPLYGLKIAWEDLDESFTTNETDLINKQMNHARLRLSEFRRELAQNRTVPAEQALDLYWQKVNLTQMRLTYFGSNATGLLHAQEMHMKDQAVLENLIISHPNNTGLARAYNNSLRLEQRFEEKTQTRFEGVMEKNNRTIFRAYRFEEQNENRAGEGLQNENWTQVRNEERVMTRGAVTPAPEQSYETTDTRGKAGQGRPTPAITTSPGQDAPVPTITPFPQGGKNTNMVGNNGNGNNDAKGNGNSRNH